MAAPSVRDDGSGVPRRVDMDVAARSFMTAREFVEFTKLVKCDKAQRSLRCPKAPWSVKFVKNFPVS